MKSILSKAIKKMKKPEIEIEDSADEEMDSEMEAMMGEDDEEEDSKGFNPERKPAELKAWKMDLSKLPKSGIGESTKKLKASKEWDSEKFNKSPEYEADKKKYFNFNTDKLLQSAKKKKK